MKKLKKCALFCAVFAGCVFGLAGCGEHGPNIVGGIYRYDNASHYLVGNSSFDAGAVRELSVDWIAGDVVLREGEGDKITFTETTDETDEDYHLHYFLNRGELKIEFQASGTKTKDGFSKELVIEYPAGHGFSDVEIDTVSSDVTVSGLTATELSVDTASGHASLGCKSVNEVSADSASGNIEIYGAFMSAECDSASGDVRLVFPQGVGFRVKFDSANGTVNNSTEATYQNKAYVSGNGQVSVKVNTANGDLILEQE